ncbi:MAG: glycosidase [Candidatus Eremiobacteraeota bacterium]|nr:glycosidase [Candidatus Eremiobacteraeota bacterium]
MVSQLISELDVQVERLGTVLAPNGHADQGLGILNPACARGRDGTLLLYPREVAQGNISRIGIYRAVSETERHFEHLGYALEPKAPYEIRRQGGYGCEDPRVTFIKALDCYVLSYTAFGPDGPRIAIATSDDGLKWKRVGLLQFSRPGMHVGDDKDAAFFPEPVRSPKGVLSLAFYHRPMLHLSAVDGRAAVPLIEKMPFEDRESIRMGYIALEPLLKDRSKLTDVGESILVMAPDAQWGSLKLGCGTPPVRIGEGWMSLYHGVDVLSARAKPHFRYSAGIMIHDRENPQIIRYRSPQPVLMPQTKAERRGVVANVVFPTGIDPRPDLGERVFDVYYGMADFQIGLMRLTLGESEGGVEPAESAA